jgi:cobalt ECF transporter T component CbiQ
MSNTLPSFLCTNEDRTKKSPDSGKYALPFIDRTLKHIAGFIKTGYIQNDTASKKGILQQQSAWAKLLFLLGFIIIISINRSIVSQLFIFFFFFLLFLFSRINLSGIYKRILALGFFFGFLFIAPAALNIITNGNLILPLIRFKTETHFWIYQIPQTIGITREGCFIVVRFCLKVINSIALTFLIVHTTAFSDLIKSLKMLRVPDMLLLTITLTYKYLFILSQTTEETYMALKSRWRRKNRTSESDQIIAGRIAYIFHKSWIKYEEIYLAMVARGFTGKVSIIYSRKISIRDVAFLLFIGMVGAVSFII